jgi:hypothetical protein
LSTSLLSHSLYGKIEDSEREIYDWSSNVVVGPFWAAVVIGERGGLERGEKSVGERKTEDLWVGWET